MQYNIMHVILRPLRIEYPGAVYHITSRGIARERIYLDDGDYYGFLDCLCSVIKRFNWILHAYCLMSNHYDKIKKLIKSKETLKEISKTQRCIAKPSLEDIFKHKDKKLIDKTAYEAHVRYGYTLKDIAEHLDVHYATISRAIKRIEERR